MKPSKTFLKYSARIKDTKTPWSETDIKYFRKAIGHCSTIKDPIERFALLGAFRKKADQIIYKITIEQNKKGLDYLISMSLRKDGEQRTTCRLGTFELRVLKNFKTHYFVDVKNIGNMYFDKYVSVYRAVAKDGSWFEYTGVRYDEMEVVAIHSNEKIRLVK